MKQLRLSCRQKDAHVKPARQASTNPYHPGEQQYILRALIQWPEVYGYVYGIFYARACKVLRPSVGDVIPLEEEPTDRGPAYLKRGMCASACAGRMCVWHLSPVLLSGRLVRETCAARALSVYSYTCVVWRHPAPGGSVRGWAVPEFACADLRRGDPTLYYQEATLFQPG